MKILAPVLRSACMVLIRRGKIAAIRSKKHGGALELPGGKAEPGEFPDENAVRECFEEVGVRPKIVCELIPEQADVGGFRCSTFLGETDDEIQSSAEGEAGWFTPEELLTGTYSEHTKLWLALPIIQALLASG